MPPGVTSRRTSQKQRRIDMRKVISAMQMSVDGIIEDPEAKQDWVENWEEDYGLLDQVDTCVLGSVTYPGYEAYWTAVLEEPEASLPLSGKSATPKEIEYATWASRTPHIVLSRKPMDVAWANSRVVSDLEEIRKLKQHPGKNIYVVGGALLVSSMISIGLIDEIRLIVNPVVLGGGKPLFGGVTDRQDLRLLSVEDRDHGRLYMIYATD
jgi:dihydrofolate reductase